MHLVCIGCVFVLLEGEDAHEVLLNAALEFFQHLPVQRQLNAFHPVYLIKAAVDRSKQLILKRKHLGALRLEQTRGLLLEVVYSPRNQPDTSVVEGNALVRPEVVGHNRKGARLQARYLERRRDVAHCVR